MSTDLSRLAWTVVPDRPFGMAPLGSCEQRGPHRPLDTDTRIADAVTRAVAGRLPGQVVAPPIAYAADEGARLLAEPVDDIVGRVRTGARL
jgi:creatinine amidohydrolase/Fe(II)-dependent formamide hydrolase-like protein